MGYSEEEKQYYFNEKPKGHCRHCGKIIVYSHYGDRNKSTGWEIDHSNPKARGGTNNPRNLYSVCSKCNMKKSDTPGWVYDKRFEARTLSGKVIEYFGGRAGDLGTDFRRVTKK